MRNRCHERMIRDPLAIHTCQGHQYFASDHEASRARPF